MYKIGDLVKIRTDLREDHYGEDGLWCTKDMVSRGGKISRVTKMYGGDSDWFYIELGNEDFIWCPEMVEPHNIKKVTPDDMCRLIENSNTFFDILKNRKDKQ